MRRAKLPYKEARLIAIRREQRQREAWHRIRGWIPAIISGIACILNIITLIRQSVW